MKLIFGRTLVACFAISAILCSFGARPAVAQGFAPYIDMSLTADENVSSIASAAGLKYITLAFLDADGACDLGWGGLGGALPTDTLADGTSILTEVQDLKAEGVTPIFSIGGADGTDPAAYCTSASTLQAAYQTAVTRYGITYLDFDIEGAATDETAQITMRDQALVGLKSANSGLVISYTIPTLPTGLVANDGLNLLSSAKSDGVNLSVVNIMAMDYGTSGTEMGSAATEAAAAVEGQIQSAGLSSTVGITPMIGQNDSAGEIFTLADATTVLNFAKANSYVSRLAMWSLGRDNGGCAGDTSASPSCSGLTQATYAFSDVFDGFGGSSGGGGSAPSAPTGLTATAGNVQVTLSWTASSGATSYNVYRGTSSGGESSTAIATGITTTTYTNTGLTNGTTYYYKVSALNSYGTSGQSSEASASPSSGATSYVGTWQLAPECATGSRLDVAGNGTANGTAVNIYQSNGTGAQSYAFATAGVVPSGDYNFSKAGGSFCVQPSGTTSGSGLEIWSCAGTSVQSWNIIKDSSPAGYYQLTNYGASSMCMDVSGAGTANNTKVQIYACNSTNAQQWSGL